MSEVVSLDTARRGRTAPRQRSAARDPADFFNRNELHAILQVYSRQVMQGEWRDYAIGWSERGARFEIYGQQSNEPLYCVDKLPRSSKRSGRYQLVTRGRILVTGKSLEEALKPLRKRRPEVVDGV